jgi:hypothetical protein
MHRELSVRHYRQILLWPLQLLPIRPGSQVQRHWEALESIKLDNVWSEVADEFCADPRDFQERHYKEFVTFLPYVQRFLYGSRAGQESSSRDGEPSLHVYRRNDIRAARVTLDPDSSPITCQIAHIDLHFFLDADIAVLAVEIAADDLTLDQVQDLGFRFGRAYPAFWDSRGEGGNCPHKVEWLDAGGAVLASSDYGDRSRYLEWVGRHRTPRVATHWEYLLQPLLMEYPGQVGLLRYRQLEYYRMPFMAYYAVDDPKQLTRADFVRMALVTRPGGPDDLPYSAETLREFERNHCDDRFWNRSGEQVSADTRIIVGGNTMALVGPHGDPFFSNRENGLLSQFRHQYFLLFLIAHFHKAAMLSISDELAVAMNRLTVGDKESVKAFKRTIRQMMEVFLRFTHRYWFHQVSNQALASSVFDLLRRHLANEELYNEVRTEVTDMNDYLDSDSARRQANTVLRLTVVTILGLIGTIATGVLGMNLIDAAEKPLATRIGMFVLVLLATFALTGITVARSKRLADMLDAVSDDATNWRQKWDALRPPHKRIAGK